MSRDGTVAAVIGVFDSGVGGISVVTSIRRLLPDADMLYVADSGRAPYGRRPLEEVRCFSEQITEHLTSQGCDIVVVACNAASAAALHHLRAVHPTVPFVGMEPAVKPAATTTSRGVVGVLTTAATFQGELFASVIDRFASDVKVITEICDGWVELVEAGEIDGPIATSLVHEHVKPMIARGADTLVLGCTHYPFLAPLIETAAGPGVTLIDPAPAVARQVARLSDGTGSGQFVVETTGDPARVRTVITRIAGLAPATRAVTFDVG